MPQSERRLYEPSDDVRFFDGGHDEYEDEGSRLPLLIVIAMVVLASFAGVVWLAYTQGVQRGREDAPRILAEQHGRGFTTNPYAQLQIYKQRKPSADAAPSVEAPTPGPTVVPQPHPSVQGGAPSAIEATPEKSSLAATQQPKLIASAKPMAAPPQSARMKPASQAQEAPPHPPSDEAQRGLVASPPVGANEKSVATGADKPANSAANLQQTAPISGDVVKSAPAPTPSQGGGFVLQIGSYTSSAEASASWQTYRGAHPTVAAYSPDVQQADLGKKGTWYRLRVGPFASMAEAGAVCIKLKAQGGSCFPTKR